jgi:hypothetical protein
MRTVSIDQFEFDNPSSEESLEIAVSKRSSFPFPDVQSFVAARRHTQSNKPLGKPVAFDGKFGYGLVREYLQRFAGVSIPVLCTWPTYILADGEGESELIMCAPDHWIHYRWATSA